MNINLLFLVIIKYEILILLKISIKQEILIKDLYICRSF